MEDWKNSDFWQKANQLHERLLDKQQQFKLHLDNYAANYEQALAQGADSQAGQLVADAKTHIMSVYQEMYGVNIYLADFMMGKK